MAKENKVLVIDSNSETRLDISGMLKLCGYKVDSCKDGDTALHKLRAKSWDIILIDLHLPGRNGFIVANKIHSEGLLKKTAIIAMTHYEKGPALDKLLDICGIERVLHKPFYPLDLISAIESAVCDLKLNLS